MLNDPSGNAFSFYIRVPFSDVFFPSVVQDAFEKCFFNLNVEH